MIDRVTEADAENDPDVLLWCHDSSVQVLQKGVALSWSKGCEYKDLP